MNRFGDQRGVTGGEFPDARDDRKTGVVALGWVILHPRRGRGRWGGMVTGRLSSPCFLPADELRATDTLALFSSLFLYPSFRFFIDSILISFSSSLSLSLSLFLSLSFFRLKLYFNFRQPHYFGTHYYLAIGSNVNSVVLYNGIRKLWL